MGTVDFRKLEERFALTLNKLENTVLTLPASDLLIEENMGLLIHTYGPLIKARERSAAAAFFMSWYAGVCGAMQHMLSSGDDQLLDLSLSNLSVQLYAGDHYPLFSFQINEARFSSIPIIDRDSWCKKTLDTFYTDNVTPFIHILSRLTQMNAIPLWGQIVNALYAQMEEDLAAVPDEVRRTSIIYHFKMLTHGVKGRAFGLRKNPFDIKLNFTRHPNNPPHKVLVKTACCLAYCLDSEFGYCYECPRLKEKDRALMRAQQQ
ncbi:hypothetical protein [Bacillus sp. FJAT-26390]|uniref:hypothetical protein n=1 Tax=Bacillus sp. FJAT-26390 TaxID=1743142 RepID=UPI000807D0C1|nr:hypothetical protein [Bacillus sp. FJAT-26390]OBZ11109.1 hypothetical protein A7975_19250 [Bacillus sp. FJAT-26390]